MANLTYYSANKINDRLFGATAYTPPTTYYLGVSTTSVGANGTGATEPSDTAYARVSIANLKTSFGNSSNGVVSNIIQFQFPESLASWGVIGYWFISDSLTGGNIWYRGSLTASKTVEAQTTLILPVGSLQITTS